MNGAEREKRVHADGLLIGQSNADAALARAIEDAGGGLVHQICHPGESIEAWLEGRYRWLEVDADFAARVAYRYVVWFQGESNVSEWDGYEAKLEEILATMNPEGAPVFVVGVWIESEGDLELAANLDAFRRMQRRICEQHANWHYVDSASAERWDGVHLTATGRRLLAASIVDQVRRHLVIAAPSTD